MEMYEKLLPIILGIVSIIAKRWLAEISIRIARWQGEKLQIPIFRNLKDPAVAGEIQTVTEVMFLIFGMGFLVLGIGLYFTQAS